MSRAARLNGFHNTDHSSDAAAPTRAWLGWHHRLGHGRQQPDDFHHHGAVHRPGRHSRTRQRGGAAAHRRRAARLGRGASVDRVGADVAQSRGWHLGRVRRSLPALQPRPRRADRHLLLVGLDPDLRSDRAPFRWRAAALVLPRAARGSCRHLHRAVLHVREPLRRHMDCASRYSHCRRLGHARFPFRLRADVRRHSRLAPGLHL